MPRTDPRHIWLLLLLFTEARAPCPANWTAYLGNCYKVTRPLPWYNVRGECKSEWRQADAVSINTPSENNFVRSLAGSQPIWLGMRISNGLKLWVDNHPLKYQTFTTDPPPGKDAVMMRDDGMWDYMEALGSTEMPGVCKMKSCNCPTGWTMGESQIGPDILNVQSRVSCYKLMETPLTWVEAKMKCREMNSYLVSIASDKENEFVHSMTLKYPFWIGGEDRTREDNFITDDGLGRRVMYYFPNPLIQDDPAEDCLIMTETKDWKTRRCHYPSSNETLPFVCERYLCDKKRDLRTQKLRGRDVTFWTEDESLRCPEGWRLAGYACLSPLTEPDTFGNAGTACSYMHPFAMIVFVRDIGTNDNVFFHTGAADPDTEAWVRYSDSELTRWELTSPETGPDHCAAMKPSSRWWPTECYQAKLPTTCEIPPCNPGCPGPWELFEGYCYLAKTDLRTMEEAEEFCKSQGAELASVHSIDEMDFITAITYPSGNTYTVEDLTEGRVWIGARRPNPNSPWYWTDCTDWDYSMVPMFARNAHTCLAAYGIQHFWSGPKSCAVPPAGETRMRAVCKRDACLEHFYPLGREPMDCIPETTTTTTPEPPTTTTSEPTTTEEPETTPEPTFTPEPRTTQEPIPTAEPSTTSEPVTATYKPTAATPISTTEPTSADSTPMPVKEEQLLPLEESFLGDFICPPKWTLLDGYCYRGFSHRMTLTGAQRYCTYSLAPAQLASVQDMQQNSLLVSLTRGGPAWLGLAVSEFPEFEWMDGDEPSFTAWADDTRDDPELGQKRCAVVDEDGSWRVRACAGELNKFVCKQPAERNVIPSPCPYAESWQFEDGACFSFHWAQSPFEKARQSCACKGKGGSKAYLPILRSSEREAALTRLANGHVIRLGLSRSGDGRWLWEDGTEPGYTNWLETPPAGQGPLCAVLDSRRGGWLAQDCTKKVAFFCQRETA